MKKYYPIFLDLNKRNCVVVGGGEVAERKVISLLEVGARVRLVSPEITDHLAQLVNDGRIEYCQRFFDSEGLGEAFLVIAATNSHEVNSGIAEECLKANILCNIVDDPKSGNYIVPAIVRQGPLTIAISTEGGSPYLSKKIRDKIACDFGPEYGEFINLMSDLRPTIIKEVTDIEERRRIFRDFVDSDIIDLLRQKDYDKVKERIAYVLGSSGSQS